LQETPGNAPAAVPQAQDSSSSEAQESAWRDAGAPVESDADSYDTGDTGESRIEKAPEQKPVPPVVVESKPTVAVSPGAVTPPPPITVPANVPTPMVQGAATVRAALIPTTSREQVWAKLQEMVAGQRRLRNVLSDVKMVSLNDEEAVFEAEVMMIDVLRASTTDLQELLRKICGRNIKAIALLSENQPARVPVVKGGVDALAAAVSQPDPAVVAESNPIVKTVMDVFNAKIVGVQRRRPGDAQG
jgi:hypothetical protein